MSNQGKEEECWVWIEKVFKKVPIPYPIASLLIAGIIYLIFWFFSTKVIFYLWDFSNSLTASTQGILIAFELAGIQYILNNMKKTFKELNSHPRNKEDIDSLYVKLKHRFSKSYWYYVIVAIIISPFIIDLPSILSGSGTFYVEEGTTWSFLLDIYNYAVGYLRYFLLAVFLWIILNIMLTLGEMRSDPYKYHIKIDIFNIDEMGGLGSLGDLVSRILIFYFICIALVMIPFIRYNISTFSISFFDIIYLIILLLADVVFFFTGVNTIRKLLRGRIEDEINKINERYQLEHQELIKLVSKGNYKGRELNRISTALQTLYVERDRMLQLYGSARGYDLKKIIQFSSSFILSIIAFAQSLSQFLAQFLGLK